MDARERALFIHDLKIRLTAVSGYAQMVERETNRRKIASLKQRVYITKLRRLINELVVAVHEYELDQRSRSARGPTDADEGDDEETPRATISTIYDRDET